MVKKMFKIEFKNFNEISILAILLLISGLIFYLYWGIRYGIWYDIGIYSITIVLVLPGIIGLIFSLIKQETEN
jgi:hypothetical protein